MHGGADKMAERVFHGGRVYHCSVGNKDGRGCQIGSASFFLSEPCFRKLAMFLTSPV